MNFDIIYINGNIITVDPSLPNAGWVAIKDGRIAAIGTENPPTSLSAKTIDLEGRTVLPGLMDSHAQDVYKRQRELSTTHTRIRGMEVPKNRSSTPTLMATL